MTVDDKVLEALTSMSKKKGGSILIVDDRCSSEYSEEIYHEHIQNEEDCERFARKNGIDLWIFDYSFQRAIDEIEKGEEFSQHDLILVSDPSISPSAGLSQTLNVLSGMKSKSNGTPVYFVPISENKSYKRASTQILTHMAIPKDILTEGISSEDYRTLAHYLNHLITGNIKSGRMNGNPKSAMQHRYKNVVWEKEYLPFIDNSLGAGNSQAEIQYQFIILSDRVISNLGDNKPHAPRKVKIKNLEYELKEEDFENCAAIFVDNEWSFLKHEGALGDGIKRLRKLREELDKKEIYIPIIYQSGHSLEKFSEEEIQEVENLGAILAAKDIFPKVCLGKEKAEKEVEISKLLSNNESLRRYISNVQNGNDSSKNSNNFFVVYSKIVGEKEVDKEKSELFQKLGIEDNEYNHRMYVLSMLHTSLKDQLNNPTLKPTVLEFFEFEELRKELGENIDNYKHVYDSIAKNPEQNIKRVISHNDAKDDNWFGGRVLGDFSNAAPGTEYKDIARSVMGGEIKSSVADQSIDNYIAIRQEIDPEFKIPNHFRKRVHEAILTESLRLAYFKKMWNQSPELVKDMMGVAEKYHEKLK